ncbi:PREDICTED: uncharacterized protein LOC109238158 [Nicotiana attenuata]|uniref:uncharacterized protein LOC109238158 n=1 Tax=Nicotiana attenuata TaxID=49451 RepID=UPI000904CB94|nr:PREDICTED: uncharacterized protein LOC109238158 [Nicotiana attenuata]
MKKLWEELNTLIAKSHCTCNCSCGAKESMHKAEHDRRLIQFLMGLNETYTVVQGSILMMNPLPSIAQAFSLLIQEERQREIKPTDHLILESSALNANTARPSTFRTNYSLNNNHNNKNRPFCDYCKRPGHTKEKCYKLHGYPQSFGQNLGHNQNPNAGQSSFNQNTRQGSNYNYNYNSNNNNANIFNKGNRTLANAHVATISVIWNRRTWRWCQCYFRDSKLCRYNLISVHSLTSHLSCIVAFFNLCCVLQAPSMKRPLVIGRVKDGLYILCPSCLRKNNASLAEKDNSKLPVISTCCTCDIHCPTHSIVNVPVHTNKCVPFPSHIVNDSCASASKHVPLEDLSSELPSFFSHSWSENNVNVLWHNRLGHVPFVKMKRITSIPVNFSPKQPFTCTICPMARQERLPFPQKTSTSNRIFELLHVDLWGPYHVPTHDKHKYFITIVDDYSRSTWTHLLSSKSNAIDVLKNFMSLIENQFAINIKSIRSDNGLEFTSGEATKLFQSKGIIHQRTCPYTPQQNGVVERKHKYLLETARALLFQSKLPLRFWDECVLCATYIINRLPSNSINNKTPYELIYKRKPKYSHLKSFGCLCYPNVPIPHRDKFSPRTAPHVFVGYPFNTKGYKVLNLATRKIYISRDVVFNESIFPFNCSMNKSSKSPIFYPVPFIDSLDEQLSKNTGNIQTTETLND